MIKNNEMRELNSNKFNTKELEQNQNHEKQQKPTIKGINENMDSINEFKAPDILHPNVEKETLLNTIDMKISKQKQTVTDKEKGQERPSRGTIQVKFESSQINGNLTQNNEEINQLSRQLSQNNSELNEKNEMINRLKAEINSMISEATKTKETNETKWIENQKKLTELEEENVRNREKLLLLNTKTIDYNKFKESEIEIKELKRQLTEKEEQNNEKSNQVLEIKHQFELFEKQVIQERKDFDKKQVEFSKSIEILTNTNVSILNDFEKQRKNKNDEIMNLTKMIDESNQTINQKNFDLQNSETKLKELEINNSKLTDLMNSKVDPNEVKILKREMLMLKTDINLKSEEIRNLKSEHRKEEQDLNSIIVRLKKQIPNYTEMSSINFNPIQSSIGKSRFTNDQFHSNIREKQSKIEHLELEIEKMKDTCIKCSEMTELRILFDEKNSQYQLLNQQATKLTNEIIEKDKNLNQLKQSIDEINNKNQRLNEEITTLNNLVNEQNSKIESSNESNIQKSNQILFFNEQISNLTNQISQKDEEIKAMKSKTNETTSLINKSHTLKQFLNEELETKRTDDNLKNDQKDEKIEFLNSIIQKKSQQINSLTETINQLNLEINELKRINGEKFNQKEFVLIEQKNKETELREIALNFELKNLQIEKNQNELKTDQLLKELEESAIKSKKLENEIEKLNAKITEFEILNLKVR